MQLASFSSYLIQEYLSLASLETTKVALLGILLKYEKLHKKSTSYPL